MQEEDAKPLTEIGESGGELGDSSMPSRYSPMRVEKFPSGGLKSVRRLNELRYDPIKEQVNLYHKLVALEKFHEELRVGRPVHLDQNGNPRRYSAQAHAEVRDQMIKVNESLLRYGYGRVPETVQVEGTPPALVINLSQAGK